jgi:hypothetical protein
LVLEKKLSTYWQQYFSQWYQNKKLFICKHWKGMLEKHKRALVEDPKRHCMKPFLFHQVPFWLVTEHVIASNERQLDMRTTKEREARRGKKVLAWTLHQP